LEEAEKNPQLCVMPFISISLAPQGGLSPCCTYWDPAAPNLKSGESLESYWTGNYLKKIRQQMLNGEWPEGCGSCRRKEAKGALSHRIGLNQRWPQALENISSGGKDFEVWVLELGLSNLCNLKCRMCDSSFSTSWFETENAMRKDGFWYRPGSLGPSPKYSAPGGAISVFLPLARHLKFISLKGGEPFLNTENTLVYQSLIKQGLAHQVDVAVTTNGTVFSEAQIQLLEKFRSVFMCFSVDGVEEVFQYIRGGKNCSFARVEKNIQRAKKLSNLGSLEIFPTLQVYNALHLDRLFLWCEGIGAKLNFQNILFSPPFLDARILPKTLKDLAVERLKKIENRIPIDLDSRKGFQEFLNFLQLEIPNEKLAMLRQQFSNFTNILDKKNGLFLRDILPELSPLIEKNVVEVRPLV